MVYSKEVWVNFTDLFLWKNGRKNGRMEEKMEEWKKR